MCCSRGRLKPAGVGVHGRGLCGERTCKWDGYISEGTCMGLLASREKETDLLHGCGLGVNTNFGFGPSGLAPPKKENKNK